MSDKREEQGRPSRADLLLVTVTEIEANAVLDLFANELGRKYELRFIGKKTYYYLGNIAGATIFMAQSEMGVSGPGGALLTIWEAIQHLAPLAVMMVGIAFGLDLEKQRIGDILVSEQILDYEVQRVGTDAQGNVAIISRAARPYASTSLLSRFKAAYKDWPGPSKAHFGLVLTGAKLIDNQDYRDKLRQIEPEAIGGEMEGAGLYAAAEKGHIDWILIKAICDWADGNKHAHEKEYQQQAAHNAVSFVLHTLKLGGFAAAADEQPSSWVATPINPAGVLLVDAPIGTTLRTYDLHSSYVVIVAWEPRGSRIASAGGDGAVRVWNADHGNNLLTFRGHAFKGMLAKTTFQPTVFVVAWSPDGTYIASAGDGTKVYVWNADTGATLATYTQHSGLLANVFTLDWSPDGSRIASACSSARVGVDKTIHIWDVKTGQTLLQLKAGSGLYPNFSVSALAWSPDGTRIASSLGDKTIQLWHAATGKLITTYHTQSDWIYDFAWSPDSRLLATANKNHTAQLWDIKTGKLLLTYSGHTDNVRDIAWSPDGSRIATASNDHTVQIWDPATAHHIFTYRRHTAWATSIAWSPDSTLIASASNDKSVHIWQAK